MVWLCKHLFYHHSIRIFFYFLVNFFRKIFNPTSAICTFTVFVIRMLSLYFEMIFPKKNSWLASHFLLFFEILRCQRYFLQDPCPFHLFPFNSPELIPDEHKTTKFCLYPEELKYWSASYIFIRMIQKINVLKDSPPVFSSEDSLITSQMSSMSFLWVANSHSCTIFYVLFSFPFGPVCSTIMSYSNYKFEFAHNLFS